MLWVGTLSCPAQGTSLGLQLLSALRLWVIDMCPSESTTFGLAAISWAQILLGQRFLEFLEWIGFQDHPDK